MKTLPLHGYTAATINTVVAHAVVDDDALDGLVRWKWKLGNTGYAYRASNGRTIYLHRYLLGLLPGDGIEVDHINGDRLDNRQANLRTATREENCQNLRPRRGGTSRFRGVSRRKDTGRWTAYAHIGDNNYRLGCFDTEEEAAAVVAAFRAMHMPFAEART